MKVYVDRLPNNCMDCPCYDCENCICNASQKQLDLTITDNFNRIYERHSKCPLQSLTDYTMQVRKEVVQEIRKKLKPKEIFHPEDEFTLDYDFYYKEDVEEILDQIQGGDNA